MPTYQGYTRTYVREISNFRVLGLNLQIIDLSLNVYSPNTRLTPPPLLLLSAPPLTTSCRCRDGHLQLVPVRHTSWGRVPPLPQQWGQEWARITTVAPRRCCTLPRTYTMRLGTNAHLHWQIKAQAKQPEEVFEKYASWYCLNPGPKCSCSFVFLQLNVVVHQVRFG
jgi:hypothetical protein